MGEREIVCVMYLYLSEHILLVCPFALPLEAKTMQSPTLKGCVLIVYKLRKYEYVVRALQSMLIECENRIVSALGIVPGFV